MTKASKWVEQVLARSRAQAVASNPLYGVGASTPAWADPNAALRARALAPETSGLFETPDFSEYRAPGTALAELRGDVAADRQQPFEGLGFLDPALAGVGAFGDLVNDVTNFNRPGAAGRWAERADYYGDAVQGIGRFLDQNTLSDAPVGDMVATMATGRNPQRTNNLQRAEELAQALAERDPSYLGSYDVLAEVEGPNPLDRALTTADDMLWTGAEDFRRDSEAARVTNNILEGEAARRGDFDQADYYDQISEDNAALNATALGGGLLEATPAGLTVPLLRGTARNVLSGVGRDIPEWLAAPARAVPSQLTQEGQAIGRASIAAPLAGVGADMLYDGELGDDPVSAAIGLGSGALMFGRRGMGSDILGLFDNIGDDAAHGVSHETDDWVLGRPELADEWTLDQPALSATRERIPLNTLRRTQEPYELDAAREYWRGRDDMPPVLVGRDENGVHRLWDGAHRAAILDERQLADIDALVLPQAEIDRRFAEGAMPEDIAAELMERQATPPPALSGVGDDARLDAGPRSSDNGVTHSQTSNGGWWRVGVDGQPAIMYQRGPHQWAVDDSSWMVGSSGLPEAMRGQGNGIRAYEALINEARANGVHWVESGNGLSPDAQNIYAALRRRGYRVEDLPDGRFRISTNPPRPDGGNGQSGDWVNVWHGGERGMDELYPDTSFAVDPEHAQLYANSFTTGGEVYPRQVNTRGFARVNLFGRRYEGPNGAREMMDNSIARLRSEGAPGVIFENVDDSGALRTEIMPFESGRIRNAPNDARPAVSSDLSALDGVAAPEAGVTGMGDIVAQGLERGRNPLGAIALGGLTGGTAGYLATPQDAYASEGEGDQFDWGPTAFGGVLGGAAMGALTRGRSLGEQVEALARNPARRTDLPDTVYHATLADVGGAPLRDSVDGSLGGGGAYASDSPSIIDDLIRNEDGTYPEGANIVPERVPSRDRYVPRDQLDQDMFDLAARRGVDLDNPGEADLRALQNTLIERYKRQGYVGLIDPDYAGGAGERITWEASNRRAPWARMSQRDRGSSDPLAGIALGAGLTGAAALAGIGDANAQEVLRDGRGLQPLPQDDLRDGNWLGPWSDTALADGTPAVIRTIELPNGQNYTIVGMQSASGEIDFIGTVAPQDEFATGNTGDFVADPITDPYRGSTEMERGEEWRGGRLEPAARMSMAALLGIGGRVLGSRLGARGLAREASTFGPAAAADFALNDGDAYEAGVTGLGAMALARIPQLSRSVLDGVGHVPGYAQRGIDFDTRYRARNIDDMGEGLNAAPPLDEQALRGIEIQQRIARDAANESYLPPNTLDMRPIGANTAPTPIGQTFFDPETGKPIFGTPPRTREPVARPPLQERAVENGAAGALQGVPAGTLREIAADLDIETQGVTAAQLRRTLARSLGREFDSTRELVAFLSRYGVLGTAIGVGVTSSDPLEGVGVN